MRKKKSEEDEQLWKNQIRLIAVRNQNDSCTNQLLETS